MVQSILLNISDSELKGLIQESVKMAIGELLPKPQQTPDLLTRNETSEYLGVSLPTLGDWTKNGIIKGYRIGGRIRYKRPDVEAALKGIETIKFKRG